MKRFVLSTIFIFMLTSLQAIAVYAESDAISKQEAISIAQQNKPGKILSISETKSKKGSAYRVKIISDGGDVHIILINAKTGSVISSR